MKYHIVHIITSLSGGGRERRMSQLVAAMRDSDEFDTHIIVYSSKNDYLPDYPSDKIHIVRKDSGKFRFIKGLYGQVNALNPDIIHVWTDIVLSNYIALRLACRGNRKLILGFLADGNIIKGRINRLLAQSLYRKASAIVSNSQAGLLAKGAPMVKSYVIYNGFDFSRLNAKPFDEKSLRKELGLGDKRIVTMVARFDRAKNWDMFIAIAEKFVPVKEVIFLAVGDGPMVEDYKSKATSNIVFAGRRNDVENILKITYVSLLFSNSAVHAEGVSNSIMESMAIGVPVIATRGGGTAEIITDGKNGFIVEPNDTNSAAERLSLLLEESTMLKEMGDFALGEIKSKFLLSTMTEKYIELYKHVLE